MTKININAIVALVFICLVSILIYLEIIKYLYSIHRSSSPAQVSQAPFQMLYSTPTILPLIMFDTSTTYYDSLAVCNDGSPGGYYYKPAKNSIYNSTWVVYLRGGGQCYDKQSCDDRFQSRPDLMSSKYFKYAISYAGLFDENIAVSPYAYAHKAALAYCTSDGYMGDVASSDITWGWSFRGQRIVLQFIRELIEKRGMNGNSTVLLAGGSAGARGMMVTIDLLIEKYLPSGMKVAAWLDSPYYVDVAPLNTSVNPNSFPGFQYQEKQKYDYMNTKGIISPECANAYAGEEWKCQFGQFRMPFVKSPYFLIASQDDKYQLSSDTAAQPSGDPLAYSDPSVVTYAVSFGNITQHNLESLVTQEEIREEKEEIIEEIKLKKEEKHRLKATKASSSKATFVSSNNNRGHGSIIHDAYFSQACYNHDTSITAAFTSLQAPLLFHTNGSVGSITMRQALLDYLYADPYITLPVELDSAENITVTISTSFNSRYIKNSTTIHRKLHTVHSSKGLNLRSRHSSQISNNIVRDSYYVTQQVWIDLCSGFQCGLGC